MDVHSVGFGERGVVQSTSEVVLDGEVGEVTIGSSGIDFETSGVFPSDERDLAVDTGSSRPLGLARSGRHRLTVWRDAGPVDGEPVFARWHVLNDSQT